ncbi:unnamed protein product [Boreogadus saida]
METRCVTLARSAVIYAARRQHSSCQPGRGSDSESDSPTQRKVPDVRKDDMLARRTSVSEPRAAVPFNQYLPTRSQAAAHLAPAPLQAAAHLPPPGHLPGPLRRRRGDQEEVPRSSWSTASSPVGGDRPLSHMTRVNSPSLEPQSHSPSPSPLRTPHNTPVTMVTPPPPPPLVTGPQNWMTEQEEGEEVGGAIPPPGLWGLSFRRCSAPQPQPHNTPPRETANQLAVSSDHSAAARCSSEEHFLRPPPLATSAAPTSPTDRKSPSEIYGEEEEAVLIRTRAAFSLAGVSERGQRRSLRNMTPSPPPRAPPTKPSFLPVPDASVTMKTSGGETTAPSPT